MAPPKDRGPFILTELLLGDTVLHILIQMMNTLYVNKPTRINHSCFVSQHCYVIYLCCGLL